MKIRNGFVSNSSSSSYMVILRQKDFNELLATMDKFEQAMIEFMSPSHEQVLGLDAVVMDWGSGEAFEHCYPSGAEEKKLAALLPHENGCKHVFDRETNQFCSKCGKPAKIPSQGSVGDYVESVHTKVWDFAEKVGFTKRDHF